MLKSHPYMENELPYQKLVTRLLSLCYEKSHSHPYILVIIGSLLLLICYHKVNIFCKSLK